LPGSNDRELEANEVFHVERFGPIAKVLGEEGISLGLEFIGPKTLRDQFTHPFHYTIAGMLGLAERIGPNVGLLLDAWHWYTSKGTLDDLRALQPDQIVYVHLNDAPEVVDIDAQVDNVRRLPGQTGVIDIAGFLDALRQIGYTGPIAVEPFYDALKELPNDEARLAAVRDSLDRIGV
jgi:sugar phosphate isomerase/epimerase